jgi:hypothetical protein
MTWIGERPSKREGNHVCPSQTGAQRLDELEFERSSRTRSHHAAMTCAVDRSRTGRELT